jgi:hypothetical protein
MVKSNASRGPTKLRLERLDDRLCMAASVGWDGAGQGNAALTYYVGETPANLGLDRAAVKATLEKALAVWSKVADIAFTETQRSHQPNSMDFEFRSIDGRGGTLAQAYFPGDVNRSLIAGDVQFDMSESWEVGNGRGSAATDFLWVAVHEIGHALGLDHSPVRGSVMSHSVSPNQSFTALAPADVDAVLRVYAPSKSGVSPSRPTSPTQPSIPVAVPDTENTLPPAAPRTPSNPPKYRYFHGFRRYWRHVGTWGDPLNGMHVPAWTDANWTPTTRVRWGFPLFR